MGITSGTAKSLGIDPREFIPEGGESWLEVNLRVHSFLEDVIKSHVTFGVISDIVESSVKQEEEESKDDKELDKILPKILCVTHGGLITEMLNVLQELEGKLPLAKDKVKNCAIYVFKVYNGEDGKIRIDSIIENDDSHLLT